jgi:hypothetical protein
MNAFTNRQPRRGTLLVLLLPLVLLSLAALALAADGARFYYARLEMANGVDAAALAGVQALAHDLVLTQRPDVMPWVVDKAGEVARAYAERQPVLGTPLALQPNPEMAPEGDVVFGFVDSSQRSAGFQPAPAGLPPHLLLNALRVTAHRTRDRGNAPDFIFGRVFRLPQADLVGRATAYLDRAIVGFQPRQGQPIPLMPIALLSDPSASAPAAWETQIEAPLAAGHAGSDRFAFHPGEKRFLRVPHEVASGDHLPEMTIRLALSRGEPEDFDAAAVVLALGNGTLDQWIDRGITPDDLAASEGRFVLDADGDRATPGRTTGPALASPRGQALIASLKRVIASGSARIWPLYQRVESMPGGGTTVHVTGFVAARLVTIVVAAEPLPHVALVLQPCQVLCGQAVTADGHGVTPHNRYVAKPRLLE